MADEVVESIIRQLGDINYSRLLHFHFLNEPLLDKRIFHFLTLAKESLPNARIQLTTNGDLLDMEVIKRLIVECRVDNIQISLHDEETEIRFTSLLTTAPKAITDKVNIKKMYDAKKVDGVANKKIISWGGSLQDRADEYDFRRVPLSGCDKTDMIIDYLGNVHPCCEDALNEYILGNVHQNTILEIWDSGRYQFREHFTGNFTKIPCDRCTKVGS